MTYYTDRIALWFAECQTSTWGWFRGLGPQDWIMLLMGVSLLGFMCMRGFGSRSNY